MVQSWPGNPGVTDPFLAPSGGMVQSWPGNPGATDPFLALPVAPIALMQKGYAGRGNRARERDK